MMVCDGRQCFENPQNHSEMLYISSHHVVGPIGFSCGSLFLRDSFQTSSAVSFLESGPIFAVPLKSEIANDELWFSFYPLIEKV